MEFWEKSRAVKSIIPTKKAKRVVAIIPIRMAPLTWRTMRMMVRINPRMATMAPISVKFTNSGKIPPFVTTL